MDLSRLYHPLTSTPLGRSSYAEQPPCEALRPYVRCFWRSHAAQGAPTLVIPDTCMDLLFLRDAPGSAFQPRFCALDDEPFVSTVDGRVVFAVRLYPWAAGMLAEEPLCGTLNRSLDAHAHFPLFTDQLCRLLAQTDDFASQCRAAEALLFARLCPDRVPPDFLNAVHAMLLSEGRLRTTELAASVQLSVRQLERLFSRAAGASPKKLSSLVRYQQLWHAAVYQPRFDVQDAVYRFGYTDQSHLLHEFRRYHSMTLSQALELARREVAFLQSSPPQG